MSTRALSRLLSALSALLVLICVVGLVWLREVARQRVPTISTPGGPTASRIQAEMIRYLCDLAPEQTFHFTLTPLSGLQKDFVGLPLWQAEAVSPTGESRLIMTFDARTETLLRTVFRSLPDRAVAAIPMPLEEAVRRARMWAERLPVGTRPSRWTLAGKPWHTETDWIVTLQSPPYVSKIRISRRTGRMTHLTLDRQH